MGKFLTISAAVVAASVVVYWKTAGDADIEPETMADDVWWGPGSGPGPDADTAIRPFQINVSAQDLTFCDYIKLALGSYWPSLVVSSEREQSMTYPLSWLFSTILEETGYLHLQMTKPDTVGIALDDSSVGLAAYILEKFSTGTNLSNIHLPDGGLSKYDMDELLDNVMVYWVTRSMTTSMRLYAEYATKTYITLPHIEAKVKVPAACAMFPNEGPFLILKKLLKRKFVNLVRATEIKKGGHFAAFEQPELLADDIWSAIVEIENINNRPN